MLTLRELSSAASRRVVSAMPEASSRGPSTSSVVRMQWRASSERTASFCDGSKRTTTRWCVAPHTWATAALSFIVPPSIEIHAETLRPTPSPGVRCASSTLPSGASAGARSFVTRRVASGSRSATGRAS